jgi:hypothetical protein
VFLLEAMGAQDDPLRTNVEDFYEDMGMEILMCKI